MIVDVPAIRAHVAARLIAYYCSKGKPRYWLKPLIDSPLFSDYFSYVPSVGREHWEWSLLEACLHKWQGDLASFIPHSVIMLVRRHTPKERHMIFQILESYYDFDFK